MLGCNSNRVFAWRTWHLSFHARPFKAGAFSPDFIRLLSFESKPPSRQQAFTKALISLTSWLPGFSKQDLCTHDYGPQIDLAFQKAKCRSSLEEFEKSCVSMFFLRFSYISYMFGAPLAVALRYKTNASPLSCNLNIFVCYAFAHPVSAMPLCFLVFCGHRSIENVWKRQQAIQHQPQASYSDISAELQTSLTTGCGLMCTLAVGFRKRGAAWGLSKMIHSGLFTQSFNLKLFKVNMYICIYWWDIDHNLTRNVTILYHWFEMNSAPHDAELACSRSEPEPGHDWSNEQVINIH